MKNKPEWLEASLAGAPVVLRDGSKAYVRYWEKEFEPYYPLYGGVILGDGRMNATLWAAGGRGSFYRIDEPHNHDIIGLWQEPAPVFEYWHLLKEDYVAIAMDSSGDWYAFKGTELVCSDIYKQWLAENGEILLLSDIFTKDALPTVSDWRQSLILRPEGENK